MAEKAKKTKVAAKPSKSAAKKESVIEIAKTVTPTREQIEQLAKSYWAARGYKDGYAEQDWLLAEQVLLQKAS
jgi:hypothetical protein